MIELLTECARRLEETWSPWELAAKSSLLLSIVLVVVGILQRRHARAASAVSNAALLGLVVLPAVIACGPRLTVWQTALKPGSEAMRDQFIAPPDTSTQSTTIESAGSGIADHVRPSAMSGVPIPLDDSPAAATVSPVRPLIRGLVLLAMLIGTIAVAVRIMVAMIAVWRLRQAARAFASPVWNGRLAHWSQQLGIRQMVSLGESPDVQIPIVVGTIRPMILLPTSLVEQSEPRHVDAILAHELAHVKRDDYAWQMLLKFVQALYWYNPLIWLLARSIASVRERACDEYCIHALGDSRRYADALLALAGGLVRRPPLSLGLAMARTPRIAARLDAIQNSRGNSACRLPGLARAVCLVIGLLMACGLASATVQEGEPPTRPINPPVVAGAVSTPNVADSAPMQTKPTGTETSGALGDMLSGRLPEMREAMLTAGGGTAATEEAVAMGLKWLATRQQRDGTWSLRGPYTDGSRVENVAAATAMAILAFQGAGHTPDGDPKDPYTDVVKQAWKTLLTMQDEQGKFHQGLDQTHWFYTQAQCTIALCELYGMTRDEAYKAPAQRAVDYCVRTQSANGGWRYFPGDPGDLSVTGWFVLALQSARMAGLEVSSPVFDKISAFLDLLARGDEVGYDVGSRYAYRLRDGATLSMSAEGLLCRQFLGWKREDPRLVAGVEHLLRGLPEKDNRNIYYWYYATQVCHHMEGPAWQKWNHVMRQLLPEMQETAGHERGSWNPQGDRWGGPGYGGRLYVTCLSIYTLEVYYRHRLLYRNGLPDDGR